MPSQPGPDAMFAVRCFGGLLLCSALAGCADGPARDADNTPRAAAQLHFLIATDRLELLQALPSPWLDIDVQVPSAAGQAKDSDLHWEMRSASDAMIASGDLPDPRIVRFEGGGMMGPSGPIVQLGGSGTLRILVPDVAGTIRFYDAGGSVLAEHGYVPIRGNEVQAADLNLGKTDFSRDSDVLGSPELVHGDDDTAGHFNILIVPDGFQMHELPAFRDAVDALVEEFAMVEPFRSNAHLLNMWRQDIRSQESGIPSFGEARDTAFNVEFGDGVSRVERCVLPSASWNRTTAANLDWLRERTAADVVVIIANSSLHGGCAQPHNDLLVQTLHSGPSDQARTLAHELGHALFDLGDEYEEQGRTCGLLTGIGRNLTQDLSSIPWLARIHASTPVPTPLNGALPELVGAFRGGGACEGEVWRPQQQCAMRASVERFCPVCTSIIESAFRRRELNLAEVEVVNRAGFSIMAGCSPLSGPNCSSVDTIEDGDSRVIQIREGKFVLYALNSGEPLMWQRDVYPETYRVVIYGTPGNPLVPTRDAGMGDAGPSDAGPGDAGGAPSQTYSNNVAMDIPDNDPEGIRSEITVDDTGTLESLRVSVDIEHTYRGDLEVFLEKDGVRAVLAAREGGGNDDLLRTFEVDEFTMVDVSGTWTLIVNDRAQADIGTLRAWSLEIETGSTPTTDTFVRDSLIVITDGSGFVQDRDTVEVRASGTIVGVRVRVDLSHESYSDLELSLNHGGETVQLAIDQESGDFVETYALDDFSGAELGGSWSLGILDTQTPGEGTLNSWTLELSHR